MNKSLWASVWLSVLFLSLFIFLSISTGLCPSWGWACVSPSCSSAPGTTPSSPWWSPALSTSISSSQGEWSATPGEIHGLPLAFALCVCVCVFECVCVCECVCECGSENTPELHTHWASHWRGFVVNIKIASLFLLSLIEMVLWPQWAETSWQK